MPPITNIMNITKLWKSRRPWKPSVKGSAPSCPTCDTWQQQRRRGLWDSHSQSEGGENGPDLRARPRWQGWRPHATALRAGLGLQTEVSTHPKRRWLKNRSAEDETVNNNCEWETPLGAQPATGAHRRHRGGRRNHRRMSVSLMILKEKAVF